MSEGLGDAAIDFTAVPDLDDFNGAGCIIDRIDDAELTLANAIASLGAGKLFTSASRGSAASAAIRLTMRWRSFF